MKMTTLLWVLSILAIPATAGLAAGAPVVRTASGANAAAIQSAVDQFRTDLGGANNGVGGSFRSGRREINWDGVPDSFSAPNFLPVDFFNVNSPRGAVFSSRTTFNDASAFFVSADANNPTATAVRFGNIDPSYPGIFQTFSAERLFAARNSNVTEVNFFIPGTSIRATVSGFGVVFADVDQPGPTYVKFYGENGKLLVVAGAPVANNGLSFAGVSFNAGERVSRVEIVAGNEIMFAGQLDNGTSSDIVAMDDFIYGEPRAADYHSGDFDGDGFKDPAVFRPSAGTFFVLNSGSNTVDFIPFGAPGDVPVEGDFDGDRRTDVAIYRPSLGEWWVNRSSNGTNFARQFGAANDKPSVGDFDRDGITDIAFWRAASGQYFILRSSSGFTTFFTQNWGTAGDLPVGAAIAP